MDLEKKKVTLVLKVTNTLGLHARPASMLAKLLRNVGSCVFFSTGNQRVDARSVMDLLLLGAGKDTEIYVEVEGEDAMETLDLIKGAFENRFGES